MLYMWACVDFSRAAEKVARVYEGFVRSLPTAHPRSGLWCTRASKKVVTSAHAPPTLTCTVVIPRVRFDSQIPKSRNFDLSEARLTVSRTSIRHRRKVDRGRCHRHCRSDRACTDTHTYIHRRRKKLPYPHAHRRHRHAQVQ